VAAQALERGGLRDDVEVWAYQVYTALPVNVAVEVTDVAAEKAEAIRIYASQMRRRDWAHYALGLNAMNCRLLRGRADACYAEAFFVVPLREYAALTRPYLAARLH
jgi:LmbE family N-acetylglucosaminyl deacetylase